ncbi:hypothetical protein LZ30DRAFT_692226 [Colletotrichum cereale]|nr:hypothetical protein LZ30DRAFT_692226 [Colletotrichum cereale]
MLPGIQDLSETAIVKCHSTGTPVRDPLKIQAVADYFSKRGVVITSALRRRRWLNKSNQERSSSRAPPGAAQHQLQNTKPQNPIQRPKPLRPNRSRTVAKGLSRKIPKATLTQNSAQRDPDSYTQ